MKPKDVDIPWELFNILNSFDLNSRSASMLSQTHLYLSIYLCTFLSAQNLSFVLEPCWVLKSNLPKQSLTLS